jgi:nitric oxide reductase large subunit
MVWLTVLVIWAAVVIVGALALPAAWAWYISGRQLAATTEPERLKLLRLAATVSTVVGVAILAVGALAFVRTGYDWVVLASTWCFGLFHLGLLGMMYRKVRRSRRAAPSSSANLRARNVRQLARARWRL